MLTSLIGDEITENFEFPNGMEVRVDYGIIFHTDQQYHPCFKRYSGSLRRSQLLDQESNVITEIIESNPDEINSETEQVTPGDEFERVIHFPNGYLTKIEYWVTPERRDENFGRYDAKYQRRILLDENNNVISEIISYNPNYRDPNSEAIHIDYEDIDFD